MLSALVRCPSPALFFKSDRDGQIEKKELRLSTAALQPKIIFQLLPPNFEFSTLDFELFLMNTEQAYNQWAAQYDTNINRTRDLEAVVLRQSLKNIPFNSCLEIGCGTGKNTEWLVTKAQQITSADLSQEMLAKAKEKINSDKVNFIQADINEPWDFRTFKI
jgi:SAM-dependent methyltransferase